MLDDMGWGNVGFHNQHVRSTPFLDEMAKSPKGMELTNVYSTHRCSPSRAAFLTGVYPYRYGLGSDALKVMYNPLGLDKDLKLLPELLKTEANYTTDMIGKWHLGHASPGDLPQNRGFDTFYGFYEAQADYFTHDLRSRHVYRDQDGPVDKSGRYMTYDLAGKAQEVLKATAEQDQPKFIYLPFQAPHLPVIAPDWVKDRIKTDYQHNVGKSLDDKSLNFHGAMWTIDQVVGRLYNIASELERETIFVFTSDNGAGLDRSADGAGGGCNWPYRGGKDSFAEGGVKVTTLVMSTKRHFKTRQNHALFHVTDWFPTLLSLAGVKGAKRNERFALDGRDFSSFFAPKEATVEAVEERKRFVIGVRHAFRRDSMDWIMDYCVRYDGWKFCNFYRSLPNVMCDVGQALPDYAKENLTESYIQKLHDTQKRHGTLPGYFVVLRRDMHVSLYDMVNDPFELTNLNKKNLPIVDEIRAWAEAEIGRPEVPVVGASKEAYVGMVRRAGTIKAMEEARWDLVNKEGKDRMYREFWYMRVSDRVEKHQMCNEFELKKYNKTVCAEKQLSTTNWAEPGIAEDFRLLTKWYDQHKKKNDNESKAKIRGFENDTLMCGKLCCPWRQARNMSCYMDYAKNPF